MGQIAWKWDIGNKWLDGILLNVRHLVGIVESQCIRSFHIVKEDAVDFCQIASYTFSHNGIESQAGIVCWNFCANLVVDVTNLHASRTLCGFSDNNRGNEQTWVWGWVQLVEGEMVYSFLARSTFHFYFVASHREIVFGVGLAMPGRNKRFGMQTSFDDQQFSPQALNFLSTPKRWISDFPLL